MNSEDLRLKAVGDSLIKSDPNFYWSNSTTSPDIAHRNIDPIGTYWDNKRKIPNRDSRGGLNFIWPPPSVESKPEKISDIQESDFISPSQVDFMFKPQKEESKQKVTTEESPKTSVIRPTITKRVVDSTGNIISEGEKISAEEAGVKGFNAQTKTWEKKRYGGYLHNYRDGGETDPPVKYISDPEEFKRREQAYNDSLLLYQNNSFSELDPSSQPSHRDAPIDLSIEEVKRYDNSFTGTRKPRLIFAQKEKGYDYTGLSSPVSRYNSEIQAYDQNREDSAIDIDPAYWRSYYNSDVGSFEPDLAPAYWGVYKKPTQPVAQSTIAKPVSGFDKKPEWAKFNSTMDRIQQ